MVISIIDTGSNNSVHIHPDHLESGEGTLSHSIDELAGSAGFFRDEIPGIRWT